jgi:hypothetical protein
MHNLYQYNGKEWVEIAKNGRNGRDGLDGISYTKEEILALVKPLIPKAKNGKDGSPDTPKQVKDKLLEVGLSYKDIKDTPDYDGIAERVNKLSSKTVSLKELDDVDLSQAIVTNGKYVIGGGGSGAVESVNAKTGVVVLDKTDIGLGNVDNTSDVTKDAATATLQNKRITPRSSTAASGDITPDLATANIWQRTGLTAGITINAPTGTPVLGEVLVFMLLDNGTSRALTWNSAFTTRVMGEALPTATTISKQLLVTAQYNGTTWLCLSSEEI